MWKLRRNRAEEEAAGAVRGERGKLWLEPSWTKEVQLRQCKHSRRDTKQQAAAAAAGNGDTLSAQSLDLEGALFKVLTFLPLRKIYELRLVSKAWNTLLRSSAFLQEWSTSPHQDLLVMVRNVPFCPFARLLVAFDVDSGHWISLLPPLVSCPRPALGALGGPLLRCVANPFSDDEVACLSDFMAVSGAPGLVCFLRSPLIPSTWNSSLETDLISDVYDPHVFSLVVLNLFTGSHRLLPTPPKHSAELTSISSSLRISLQPLPHGAYHVFLQPQHHCFPGPLEIYNSYSGSWKVGKSCCGPSEAKIATAGDLNRADLVQYLEETDIVFAYSVDRDEWSQVFAKSPLHTFFMHKDGIEFPLYFRDRCILCRNRGRVFLVAVQCADSSFAGFGVWELRLHHSEPPISAVPGMPIADWVQVARTPQHLWKGFYGTDKNNYCKKVVKIVSSGNLICMTAIHYDVEEYAGTYYPPLVYDLVRDLWYHLPPYKGGSNFIAAFCLEPSFIAMA